jgi:hypothetical protein
MYRCLRLWPYAVFLMVCASGMYQARPRSSSGSSHAGNASSAAQPEHDVSLVDRLQAVRCRDEARCRIARRVRAGWLTLLEAAEHFRDLNEAGADFYWKGFRTSYAGTTDDERCCRQVIDWVVNHLENDTGQSEAEKMRLEAELCDHLQRGTLRLPR